MLLARDFQYGRNGLVVILQEVTHIIRDMLVDEDDPDVVPLGERFQRALHDLGLRVLLDR